jgi:nifR3 family TIM-barrel protein
MTAELLPAATRPPPLVIGRLRIAPPVLLAPMSALSNLPMRALSEAAGCGFTVTEFLAAPGLSAKAKRELRKLQPSPGRPFGAQIFGRDPRQMARAAEICVAGGAALVDLNMGCPARKVTKGCAGAALMREPALATELVRAVSEAVAGRAEVTVKIRSGWDDASKNAPEFATRMVEAGAQAVTVHGRTRAQAFAGVVDLEIIAEVKRALPTVPVIGNGDITDEASLERMFAVTGCDGAMIGRAALGNPWIFGRALAWWTGTPPPPPPTPAERLAKYREHLLCFLENADDEEHAVIEMRKFAGWYLRGFPGAGVLRKAIYAIASKEALFRLLTETRL